MPANVLVTSLSRKVPLVGALREAMTEEGGGVLWGGDADPGCVGRYFVDRFWEMPLLSRPGAADEVLEFCAANEIALLVPTRDGELAFFADLRDRLEQAGTYVPVGTPDAIATCIDKLRFHRHCEALGIPTPETATSVDELRAEEYVVKERHGAGSASAGIGLGREEAREHATRLREPIFQPLVGGVEHSIDIYVNRAGRVVEAAPRTRIRVHEGESAVTETVDHPQLVEAAVRFVESIELRGHAVVQGLARGADVTLLECNPRVGGASTLGFHAGVATPAWLLREARGEAVEPRLGEYRRGLRLVRYPVDRVFEP